MSTDLPFSLADRFSDPLLLPFILMAFAVGLCIGSFLNVCIARWPLELSVVKPRSRCPRCGRQIRWYENIPIVSWLALRARCPGCGLPISAVYPAVELLVGIGWALAVAAFGPTLTALNVAVFSTVLLGIAVTDYQHYLIPDGFTVFGLIWVLALSVLTFLVGEQGPFAAAERPSSPEIGGAPRTEPSPSEPPASGAADVAATLQLSDAPAGPEGA